MQHTFFRQLNPQCSPVFKSFTKSEGFVTSVLFHLTFLIRLLDVLASVVFMFYFVLLAVERVESFSDIRIFPLCVEGVQRCSSILLAFYL